MLKYLLRIGPVKKSWILPDKMEKETTVEQDFAIYARTLQCMC